MCIVMRAVVQLGLGRELQGGCWSVGLQNWVIHYPRRGVGVRVTSAGCRSFRLAVWRNEEPGEFYRQDGDFGAGKRERGALSWPIFCVSGMVKLMLLRVPWRRVLAQIIWTAADSRLLISARRDAARALLPPPLNLGWTSADAKLMLANYLLNGLGWGASPGTLVGSREKSRRLWWTF